MASTSSCVTEIYDKVLGIESTDLAYGNNYKTWSGKVNSYCNQNHLLRRMGALASTLRSLVQ